MERTIVHLIATPGTGKYTIGAEIARRTGARLVDNHSIANVVFNVIAPDGVTPLPEAIWPRVRQVRAAVLNTLADVATPGLSYVFTNYLRGEDPGEEAMFQELVDIADARGDTFVPVLLHCAPEELLRRAVTDDRRARMKLVNPAMVLDMDEQPHFQTAHPNVLTLDVTHLSPAEAAATIIAWAESR